MRRLLSAPCRAVFFSLALLGTLWFTGAARAEESAFQASLARLQSAQRALAEGHLAEARSVYTSLLQRQDAPAHHRAEAQERLQEIERLERGLPARDPAATRLVLPQPPKAAVTYFVAADGDDANPGTKERPFRTLEHARDALRQLKRAGGLPAGGAEVCLRGGDYRVTQPWELSAEDSGTETAPIVYRACEGETPRLRGGIRVTGFHAVEDPAVLARLPEEARGKVVSAELKPLGVTSLKPLELGGCNSGRGFVTHPTCELFFNGQALPLARWPNQGFVKIADIVVHDGEPSHGLVGSKTGRLLYEGDRPARWTNEPDAWLYGYWFWNWADSYEPISKIHPEQHEIALKPPYPGYGFRKGQPFCAVNLLAEIDMPGEWYLDRQACVLYFWPPSEADQATVELSLNEFPFVRAKDVSWLTLAGLTWELGGGDGLLIEGGEHCLLAGCTVRRCAGNAVEVRGGTGHGLLSCDLHSMGRGGTVVSGGDRKTLTPGGHFIENCHIWELSRIDHTYTPAILISGVGNRIAHNYCHDMASSAVRVEGNDTTVEYNDVYRVVLESDDQGGAELFLNPTFRGNVFRFNYWHEIGNWRHPNQGPDCGQAGIRLDDAISGVLIYGNIFYRASSGKAGFGGVQIHGGKDTILDNNLFIDCESAISLSPWGEKRWREFTNASVDWAKIDRDLYLRRYPELAQLSENHDRNTIARNVVVQCPTVVRRDRQWNEVLDNLVTNEPGFRDAAEGDFALSSSSSACRAIGFRPIPVEEIGLYVDAYRKEVPPKSRPAQR